MLINLGKKMRRKKGNAQNKNEKKRSEIGERKKRREIEERKKRRQKWRGREIVSDTSLYCTSVRTYVLF